MTPSFACPKEHQMASRDADETGHFSPEHIRFIQLPADSRRFLALRLDDTRRIQFQFSRGQIPQTASIFSAYFRVFPFIPRISAKNFYFF
jgi:hypothetical protein